MALVLLLLFFERLGDEYFSWWYVQDICCHMALALAFMHLYSNVNLRLFSSRVFSILLYLFKKNNKSDIETPDRNGQWYQLLRTLIANFHESNTEGTNFQILFVCFTFV